MPINWNKLEFDIKTYLEEGKNSKTSEQRSHKMTAKYIETLYITEMKANASDIFLNPLLSINVGEGMGLSMSLEKGFDSSFKTLDRDVLNKTGISGAVQHWQGAQMGFFIPAPGMAYGVNNTVTGGGSVIAMNLIGISNTVDLLSKQLIIALKAHAGTIQGLYSGVTPAGSPIVIPWVGIV